MKKIFSDLQSIICSKKYFNYLPLLLLAFLISSCVSIIDRSSRFKTSDENRPCHNIVSASKPWMGTPYLYGGNTKNGVDCSGFVQQIYLQVFNYKLSRTTEAMYGSGTFVRGNWLKCGDLLFFKNIRGRGVDHVGIYIGQNRFIHASSSRGVVIDNLTATYYVEHFVSARRYLQ
ncbi:MAG: NlpC/P60 family protein [Calditrichaeota bacterium]|nr:MAG: NlpC/P60 family protein [Calditrichota bacterium]MBL1206295.1 NlpC/P60 family protein [Calditrichota bacterium]NOG46121.1 C40 family peptidase [Calditrichota bacterium]